MINIAIDWLFDQIRAIWLGFANWLINLFWDMLEGIWEHWFLPGLMYLSGIATGMYTFFGTWLSLTIERLAEWLVSLADGLVDSVAPYIPIADLSAALNTLASLYSGLAWILPVKEILGIVVATLTAITTIKFARFIINLIPTINSPV